MRVSGSPLKEEEEEDDRRRKTLLHLTIKRDIQMDASLFWRAHPFGKNSILQYLTVLQASEHLLL